MHALLFIAALLAQDPLQEDVDRAVAQLYSERGFESELAKQELVEIGRRAIPKIIAEFRSPRQSEATTDADKKAARIRVRRLLCEILGRIRDNSQPVLDALTERLRDADEYGISVAAAAAGALAAIADERTAPALVTALTSRQADTDKWLKYHCIHALGALRAASAAEALKKALEDTGAAQIAGEDVHIIAAAAADALARIRAKDAADGLGKLLNDTRKNAFTEQQVAVHAARALERILGESKGPLEGDQQAVFNSLSAWRKWWDEEQTKKNAATTRQRIAEIAAAIEAYKRDHGKYPVIPEYLKEKPAGHTGTWPEGGYYKGELRDAWGRPFKYDTSGANGAPFDLISYGRDGNPWGKGDNADLWNHDRWKAACLEKTRKSMDEILAALKKCREDHERTPDRLDHLMSTTAPPGFTPKKDWPKEGYLKALPKDGFDGQFDYHAAGTANEPFDLTSFGADRVPGGVDENADVWNHENWKTPRVEETKKRLEALVKAIDLFKKDQDRFPAKLEDLNQKPAYAKKWPAEGTYYRDLSDPFGNPYVYRAPGAGGKSYDLLSLGADGREGGSGHDGDIPCPAPK